MTIKTIKELAHHAQQRLQASTGNSFKKTHVYELMAASFGFNSYAALNSMAVFTQGENDAEHLSQYGPVIRQRCIDLGYQPAIADATLSGMLAFLEENLIDVAVLTDLVGNLREEYLDYGGYPYWDDGFSPILLDGLEVLADKGNAVAHYALALINAPYAEDRNDNDVGSPYWYSQEKQGRLLTGVEKEWADAYAQQLAKTEKFEFHLRESGRLGNELALLDLAERFGDSSFFENAHDNIDEDPMRVAEIAEELGRHDDVRSWLIIAAEAGDTEAMRRLIEEFDQDNLEQCWTWLYLAQLVGTDLTRDDYYAMNEDGSSYDDDVGGPMFVGGRGGVELTPLDVDRDSAARKAADELFKRIQQNR
ncbi:MAG: hypothetical protein ACOYMG_12305 [Candidatus Methylumidiphilus sp.]